MRRAIWIVVGTLALSVPARGELLIGPENWANVTLYRVADPPQDLEDLPSSPEGVPVDELSFFQQGSAPIDQTFRGVTPLNWMNGYANEYSMHVLADARPTAVRAAFQTTYHDFQASNLLGALYRDSSTGLIFADSRDIGYVDATMRDSVLVTGPGAGSLSLTLLIHLEGSNSYSWGYREGGGSPEPWTLGGFGAAGGLPLVGTGVDFRTQGDYDQDVSLTFPVTIGEPTPFYYGFSFAQYSPAFFDPEASARMLLNGSMDYNFFSTAELQKILVTLPAGSDPSQYQATFGTGTAYNVEFQVASVPEPSSLLLLGLGCALALSYRLLVGGPGSGSPRSPALE